MTRQTNKKFIKMESKIVIKTETEELDFNLEMDNSTDFKDLRLDISSKIDEDKKKNRSLFVNIDNREGSIEINGMKFSGLVLQQFKEFINQIK